MEVIKINKNRFVIILVVLFACLLCVSAVSAVDVATSQDNFITVDDSSNNLQAPLEDNIILASDFKNGDNPSLTIPNIELDIKEISIISPSITAGDSATATVKLSDKNKAVLGDVAFSIDGGTTWFKQSLVQKSSGILIKSYYGYAEYTFENLTEGTYNVLVKYYGNEAYASVEDNFSFTVNRLNPIPVVVITPLFPSYGDTITVNVIMDGGLLVKQDPTGTISFSLDNIDLDTPIRLEKYCINTYETYKKPVNLRIVNISVLKSIKKI